MCLRMGIQYIGELNQQPEHLNNRGELLSRFISYNAALVRFMKHSLRTFGLALLMTTN